VAALAAGNTAIVKPNSLTPATARVIREVVQAVFEERLVSAFEGDDSDADVLLDLPVDHIFFTGSPAVGKVIMAAAARHLARVTSAGDYRRGRPQEQFPIAGTRGPTATRARSSRGGRSLRRVRWRPPARDFRRRY
jgi:hypothetical protein